MPDTETKSRFFKLKDHVGVNADGNLEPLVAEGIALEVPTMVGKDIVDVPQAVYIVPAKALGDAPARIVPGTRIVESRDYRINAALLSHGKYERIDPPSKAQLAKEASETTDAQQGAGRFDIDGEEKE